MTEFELKPTAENLIKTMESDAIGRNIDIFRFITILQNVNGGSSISLDAKWGAGKTFFVKQAKLIMDAFNENSYGYDATTARQVRNIVSGYKGVEETLSKKPCVSVYYDAWANDNDTDPVLSLVYSIIKEPYFTGIIEKERSTLDIVVGIAEVLIGRNVKTLTDSLSGEDILKKVKEEKSIQEEVKEFVKQLLPEHGERLIIIVDELDRCKPSYAVLLLERIKHYFDIDNIVFVFATNLSELQHTITNYYGIGFDASRYLDRFFNINIALPPADMRKYYQQIGLENGSWVYEKICQKVVAELHFELREIAHFYSVAKAVAFKPTHKQGTDLRFSFGDGKALQFCLLYILPLMIGLKLASHQKYRDFVEGRDGSYLSIIIDEHEASNWLQKSLLDNDETFAKVNESDTRKVVAVKDKLAVLYDALFIHDFSNSYEPIQIGDMSFSAKTRNELFRIESGLSQDADFTL